MGLAVPAGALALVGAAGVAAFFLGDVILAGEAVVAELATVAVARVGVDGWGVVWVEIEEVLEGFLAGDAAGETIKKLTEALGHGVLGVKEKARRRSDPGRGWWGVWILGGGEVVGD